MRIPIVIPSGNLSNDGLVLCQFEDSSVVTQGESGAIGRMSIGESAIKFDIKGKQYSGSIFPTYTAIIISNPSAATSKAKPSTGSSVDEDKIIGSQGEDIGTESNIIDVDDFNNNGKDSNKSDINIINNEAGKGSGTKPKLESKIKSISNQVCYFKLENSTFDNFAEGFANESGDEDDGKGEDVVGKKRKMAEQQAKNKKNKNLINISSNVQKKKKTTKKK